MPPPVNILVIQTAFPGDVVLTLPLVGRLKREIPGAAVDFLGIPASAGLLGGHPDIRRVIEFDKRGADSGARGLLRVAARLRAAAYECAIVPHRSLRSALLARLAGIPSRIGFDRSAGRFFWTSPVRYDPDAHEILRNLSLLEPLGIRSAGIEPPRLYPSAGDRTQVDNFLRENTGKEAGPLVALAPGSVWYTKRWPEDRFARVARELVRAGKTVVLIGGPQDTELCSRIASAGGGKGIVDASGKFSLLGSAELIGRSVVLVCNDSAPLHLAAAMGTRVVSVFGATIPGFGFGPTGPSDTVVETTGLSCRPCSIHGGRVCPVGTFDCMNRIEPCRVIDAVLGKRRQGAWRTVRP
ncbi:MAG TPA: glycosyltransferase family 9 protein [Bacteroidota bacterium]|nr:glycosyltransferase family 9 protein [Bacteroidota bacterium]